MQDHVGKRYLMIGSQLPFLAQDAVLFIPPLCSWEIQWFFFGMSKGYSHRNNLFHLQKQLVLKRRWPRVQRDCFVEPVSVKLWSRRQQLRNPSTQYALRGLWWNDIDGDLPSVLACQHQMESRWDEWGGSLKLEHATCRLGKMWLL